MKLFEAGRCRLRGMADGLVCVTQSEDGELVRRFKGSVTLQEERCGSAEHGCPGCGVPGRFGGRALKTMEGLWGKAGILIP